MSLSRHPEGLGEIVMRPGSQTLWLRRDEVFGGRIGGESQWTGRALARVQFVAHRMKMLGWMAVGLVCWMDGWVAVGRAKKVIKRCGDDQVTV